MKRFFLVLPVTILVLSILIYKGFLDDFFINEYHRFDQFKNYQTKKKCPSDFSILNYCLSNTYAKPKQLFIGDSSILAVAGSLDTNTPTLFIGGGSCPLIDGIIASFSEPGCELKSKLFMDRFDSDYFSELESVYIMHRSEYLLQLNTNVYIGLMEDFIDKLLERKISVNIVLEPKSLSNNPERCISRRMFESTFECFTYYPEVYDKRFQILNESNLTTQYKVITTKINSDFRIETYKDSVHITASSIPCYYSEFNKISNSICLE